MTKTVRQIPISVLFFQAQNDYDVAPSIVLHKEMVKAGKVAEVNLYPAFGSSDRDGHSFAYRGISIWEADTFRFLDAYCGAD
ncbi:hypothetical protein [Asticcacaulis endophyticus]|uniref:Prolyl oligopeptidase family protein n=1 Tax=Asticcacaulis endophyticus TaxID=1395890 RepID=A0A918Q6T7_9CAUL|nr:hypothetical protein [Asticcacaulis endophyticus]GGZ32662.1 hypothetical protein GCM10011273_18550 [Asticcacaulis endophyticus]